jgi:hypothetical protein
MMGAGSAGPLLIKKITTVLNRDSEAKAMQRGTGAWSWLLTSPHPLKSVLHPARFKAANCKAALWSSVDTRA